MVEEFLFFSSLDITIIKIMPIIPKPTQIAMSFGSILLIFCRDDSGAEFSMLLPDDGVGDGDGVTPLSTTVMGVAFADGLEVGLSVGFGVGVAVGH